MRIINQIPLEDMDYIIEGYNNVFNSNAFRQIGSGSYSKVYSYKNYAIKYYTEDACNEDGKILEAIGNNEFFPKLYFYCDEFMVVELIDGITIDDFLYNQNESYNYNLLCEDKQERILKPILYKSGYLAEDIHDENVMITKKGRLVIIDVGLFKKHECDNFKDYYKKCKKTELNNIKRYTDKVNNRIIKDKAKLIAKNAYERELKKELETSLQKFVGHPNSLDIIEFIKKDVINILNQPKSFETVGIAKKL